jgi:hypothetical protein
MSSTTSTAPTARSTGASALALPGAPTTTTTRKSKPLRTSWWPTSPAATVVSWCMGKRHFVIRNIKAKNITPDFSKKAGIDNATVAIYGCDNFIIDNVDMVNSAGMLIGYGVIKGDYLSIPQNFKLNIHLDNRQLPINCAEYRFHPVTRRRLWRLPMWKCSATLELHNKPQHLFYAISM